MTGEAPSADRAWVWWATSAGIVLGAIGVAAIVAGIGLDRLIGLAAAAWPVLLLGVGLELGATLLRARALHVFLRPSQRMIGYPRVVVAQAAGGAMADVTPTGVLADATKLTAMLGRVPAPAVVSAIVTYDVTAMQVGAYVILAGTVVAAFASDLPPPVAAALWASAAIQLALLAALSWAIRRGLTRTAIAALAGVRIVSPSRRDRWIARVADVDARLQELEGRRPVERAEGFGLILGGRVTSWIELYALLGVVGIHPDPALFATIVLGQLPISRLSSVIPFGLGARDAGVAGLFVLLGLPAAAGASLVLLVRARQVASATLGLGALTVVQAIDRIRAARARAALRRRVSAPAASSPP